MPYGATEHPTLLTYPNAADAREQIEVDSDIDVLVFNLLTQRAGFLHCNNNVSLETAYRGILNSALRTARLNDICALSSVLQNPSGVRLPLEVCAGTGINLDTD